VINTTVGRVIFNDALPEGTPFVNGLLRKKGLQQLVQYCYLRFDLEKTVKMLDTIKDLGFLYATKAGISIGIDDLITPEVKGRMVSTAQKEVIEVEKQYLDGAITNGERYNKVISIWSAVTEKVADAMFDEMEEQDKKGEEFNPIYIMADSGARGSKQQIRQLAGMRGLMAKPSGEIIENPITSNFREGLTVLQYFTSTHGARKGLADTALKTADSGYLTRRLVDVSQDVIISEHDCGTVEGIDIRPIIESGEVIEPLRDRIIGRVSLESVKDPIEGGTLVKANEEITEETANEIQAAGIDKVRIRSVLTCESGRGVCALCYGRDLATGRLVEMGLAVGVIAAQSIGEPGTQLTMRTFHIGGTASHATQQTTLESKNAGTTRFHNLTTVKDKTGDLVVMNRSGALIIQDQKGRERERHAVVYGARLKVGDGHDVKQCQLLVEWDPYSFTIMTEANGKVTFRDVLDGQTVHEQVDENTGMSALVIIESPDEKKQPRVEVRDEKGKIIRKYLLPSGAHSSSRPGDRRSPRSSPRSTGPSSTVTCRSSTARSSSPATTTRPASTSCLAGRTSTSRRAKRSGRASRSWTDPSIPTTSCGCGARRSSSATWSTRSRRCTASRASTSTTSTSR
jgi:DNA-directed RNA polymerase subunit beta'